MSLALTDLDFVTPGPWGPGLSRKIFPGEVDNNLFQLALAIFELQSGDTATAINGIAAINVNGTQMTITLLDGTVLGPFTLPVLTFRWREEWTAATDYAALDVVKVTGTGIFMVQITHTSDPVAFDPDAVTDPEGDSIYLKLFGSADAAIKTLSDVELQLADATPDNAVEGDFLVLTGSKWKNTSHPDVAAFPFFSMTAFALTAGELFTTAFSGSFEYTEDGMYLTHVGGERGFIVSDMPLTQHAAGHTLTSQTAAQAMFNTPSNGRFSFQDLSGGTYFFECEFDLSSMSGTSGAFGFAIGGTQTYDYIRWSSEANKATLATAASAQNTVNLNSLANTAICTATTATVGWAKIKGILRIPEGITGTLIPQVSLGIAAAAVVGRDSYFRIWRAGARAMVSVGPWD